MVLDNRMSALDPAKRDRLARAVATVGSVRALSRRFGINPDTIATALRGGRVRPGTQLAIEMIIQRAA